MTVVDTAAAAVTGDGSRPATAVATAVTVAVTVATEATGDASATADGGSVAAVCVRGIAGTEDAGDVSVSAPHRLAAGRRARVVASRLLLGAVRTRLHLGAASLLRHGGERIRLPRAAASHRASVTWTVLRHLAV